MHQIMAVIKCKRGNLNGVQGEVNIKGESNRQNAHDGGMDVC